RLVQLALQVPHDRVPAERGPRATDTHTFQGMCHFVGCATELCQRRQDLILSNRHIRLVWWIMPRYARASSRIRWRGGGVAGSEHLLSPRRRPRLPSPSTQDRKSTRLNSSH